MLGANRVNDIETDGVASPFVFIARISKPNHDEGFILLFFGHEVMVRRLRGGCQTGGGNNSN